MSEVITFINMKGGVGKTTLAVNVAYTLSKIERKKVLLIDIKFVKKDVNFLTKQVDILSSIVNTLLIIFYFQEYIKFDENTEKSLIRSAISNDLGYKKKVVEVLEEI